MLAPTEKFEAMMLGTFFRNEFNCSICVCVNPVVPTAIRFPNAKTLGMLVMSASGFETKSTTSLSAAAFSISEAPLRITSEPFIPTSLSLFPISGLELLHTAPAILTSDSL